MMQVYAYYNTFMKTFSNPFYDDHDVDTTVKAIKKGLQFAYYQNKQDTANKFAVCELYHLGTFDEETGLTKTEVSLLFKCNEVLGLPEFKLEEEGDKHGE